MSPRSISLSIARFNAICSRAGMAAISTAASGNVRTSTTISTRSVVRQRRDQCFQSSKGRRTSCVARRGRSSPERVMLRHAMEWMTSTPDDGPGWMSRANRSTHPVRRRTPPRSRGGPRAVPHRTPGRSGSRASRALHHGHRRRALNATRTWVRLRCDRRSLLPPSCGISVDSTQS